MNHKNIKTGAFSFCSSGGQGWIQVGIWFAFPLFIWFLGIWETVAYMRSMVGLHVQVSLVITPVCFSKLWTWEGVSSLDTRAQRICMVARSQAPQLSPDSEDRLYWTKRARVQPTAWSCLPTDPQEAKANPSTQAEGNCLSQEHQVLANCQQTGWHASMIHRVSNATDTVRCLKKRHAKHGMNKSTSASASAFSMGPCAAQ